MAGRVYLSMAYVAPRAALWTLLFFVALVDGLRHRSVRSRGCVARLVDLLALERGLGQHASARSLVKAC